MQIKKKRSTNYQAALAGLGAAATALMNTNIASADTVTGWDRDFPSSGSLSDATSALSSARSDITSQAASRASSVTSNAPKPNQDSKIGWVDVYVDHTNMDDALRYATARGVNVVHDDTVVKMGDASATAQANSEATSYYSSVAANAKSVADKYVQDLANYEAEKAKNQADADRANDQMHALESTLAAQGQTVNMTSKQYSDSDLAGDTAAIQKKIQDGKNLLNAKAALARIQSQQNAMTLFASQEAMGNIHLKTENVTIGSQADADKYLGMLQESYARLQEYARSVSDQTGSIPDSSRPTYTIYTFTIDPTVERLGTEVVPVYHYTPIPVTKPVQPSINYHVYDIRSQATAKSDYDNKDTEVISLSPNANAGGKVVAQAMVNQIVGLDTDRQPLPSDRFDKIHSLEIVTRIPDNAEYLPDLTNTDPLNWTVTYDEASRTVRQVATAEYLVQLNLNQNTTQNGAVGGTVAKEWNYHTPQVFFKLLNDNTTYQTHSTAIVNHEYQYVGGDVQIRTDQADPAKANTNSRYQLIDGREVLPGSINNYIVGWDFNQYKNVNVDRDMQAKGLVLIDDYPEEAVSLTGPIQIVEPNGGRVLFTADLGSNANAVGASGQFKDASGKAVDGLTWTIVDGKSAPDGVKDKLNGKALMIKYSKVDGDFYKNYVETGHSLDVVMPMTTLKIDNRPSGSGYNGNKYSNVAYQSDFGNVYKSNTVENTAPKIDPQKDAVIAFGDLTSLDINKNPQSTIERGSYFNYRLNGTSFSNNLSEDITKYQFVDTFDAVNDRYDGEFLVQTDGPIYFKKTATLAERYPDGLAAGTDVTKYFTQKIDRTSDNKAIATVTLNLDRDFLDQIDQTRTKFHFDAYLTMKRTQNAQNVKNTFREVVNNEDYTSNIVVTNSRKNAVDELNEKLASLVSSAASGIASNASGVSSNASAISSAVSSFAGALSIVIKNITDVRDSASSAISSLASSGASADSSMADTISQVSSAVDSKISSVASSANSAIESNSSAIDSVQSSVASQMDAVASATAKAISALADRIENRTAQKLNRLDIYEASSEQEALNYAISKGVPTGSIRDIEKQDDHYVVIYNGDGTAINSPITLPKQASASVEVGGASAKTEVGVASAKTDVGTAKSDTDASDTYTLETDNEDDAKAILKMLGVDLTKVKSLTKVNGKMRAVVAA